MQRMKHNLRTPLFAGLAVAAAVALNAIFPMAPLSAEDTQTESKAEAMSANSDKIILAGGCFWCTEAVFERLEGVTKVVSGYAGGPEKNPTYKQVSAGATGHTEVIEVTFDTSKVSLEKVLETFWAAHDPTQVDRQGPDWGKQYRSAIYYYGDEQKAVIDKSLAVAKTQFDKPIATEIKPAEEFWPAEEYHQNFYEKNPRGVPYIEGVLLPKLEKLEKTGVIKEERNNEPGL